LQRRKSQLHEQRRRHRHGCAKSSRALKERTEAKRDEHHLHTRIGRELRELAFEQIKPSALHGEAMQENDVHHHPTDGHESVSRSIHCGHRSAGGRHPKDPDGNG